MFIIELIYKAPLGEIDALMKRHVAYLKKYYAAGNFLVSGRKVLLHRRSDLSGVEKAQSAVH